jgi:hypothetical protein
MVKKGDEVAFDADDDDGCWGIVSQDSVHLALSTYQTGKTEGGGRKQMVNMTLRSILAAFTPPTLPFMQYNSVYNVHEFPYNDFVTGEDE